MLRSDYDLTMLPNKTTKRMAQQPYLFHFSWYFKLAFAIIGALINAILGFFVHIAGVPMYFDSILTIVISVCFGLISGIITGGLTNIFLFTMNCISLPFAICNVGTALIVFAMLHKRYLVNTSGYLWLGLWLGLWNGVAGSVISSILFGGVVEGHTGIDTLVSGFAVAGQSLFSAVFVVGFLTNLIDKVLSAIIALCFIWGLSRNIKLRQLFPAFGPNEKLPNDR